MGHAGSLQRSPTAAHPAQVLPPPRFAGCRCRGRGVAARGTITKPVASLEAVEVDSSEESDGAGLKARFAGDAARASLLPSMDSKSAKSLCSRARRPRARSLTRNITTNAAILMGRRRVACRLALRRALRRCLESRFAAGAPETPLDAPSDGARAAGCVRLCVRLSHTGTTCVRTPRRRSASAALVPTCSITASSSRCRRRRRAPRWC